MKITKANGKAEYALIENLKKRAGETDEKIVEIVTTILNEVKKNGDDAVREYTVRFDGGLPKKSVIEKDELQSYLDKVDDDLKTQSSMQKTIFMISTFVRHNSRG